LARAIVAPLQQFPPEDAMISFLAVVLLSFMTLCLGTWVADRFEQRLCVSCGLDSNLPPDGAGE
jgi:hypothetical protein